MPTVLWFLLTYLYGQPNGLPGKGLRITLGPIAAALAAASTDDPTAASLDEEITKLQLLAARPASDVPILPHLEAVYESMASVQLMLLSLTAKEDTQMAEAVERMSIRCAALVARTAKLNDLNGPKLTRLTQEMMARDHMNERGIEPLEKTHDRGGREH